jgi:hypothetical protein
MGWCNDDVILAEACVSFVVARSEEILSSIARRRIGCASLAALVHAGEAGLTYWSAGNCIEGAWAVDVVELALREVSLLDEISEHRVLDRRRRVDALIRHQGGGAVAVAHVEHLRRHVG